MSAYVEISQLVKAYPKPGGGQAVIVKDFNLKITKGEFITVIGHSGCGKSTQLMMLAGLSEITSGVIIIDGKEIAGPGPDRGIVFQSPSLLPWMTAKENVMLGIEQVFYTASQRERDQIAEYYLSVVGLAASMHKRPPSSRKACANASASPAPSPSSPRCSSSTSPSACSTHSRATNCRPSSSTFGAAKKSPP